MITVTIWHNVAHDGESRHSAMLDGYQPGDPMVRVFTYQADPAGRPPEEIAEEAFDTFNDHPRNPGEEELARQYYRHRLLRSLSSPETHRVASGRVAFTVAPCGLDPVFAHGISLREPAWSADIDLEEVE
jgi:hypothetical protein